MIKQYNHRLEAAMMRVADQIEAMQAEGASVVYVFHFDGREFTPCEIWITLDSRDAVP